MLVSVLFHNKSSPGKIWNELAEVVNALPASSVMMARSIRC